MAAVESLVPCSDAFRQGTISVLVNLITERQRQQSELLKAAGVQCVVSVPTDLAAVVEKSGSGAAAVHRRKRWVSEDGEGGRAVLL